MRLLRIEAVRYGALAGAALGELGPGLTVVHGPNEAGKSSFTSLVRHVLYGYPNLRDSEDGYHVSGEGRCARLVFEDGTGSWVIERTEGTHGGTLRVRTISGPDRPTLVDDLTRGVSGRTFRTVFGFGLDQMALIAQERSSEDGVIARLYAAGAGLRVNPQEIRAAVEREAAELFKPAGRKQVVNEHVAELRRVRSELRDLRTEAESFLGDQGRLRELEADLARARAARDAARERAMTLVAAIERADAQRSAIGASEAALPELLRERKRLAEEAAGLQVDETLLNAAPQLEALLDEASGHVRAMQSLQESEAAVVRAETRYADTIARAAVDAQALDALAESHDSAAAIEQAREDLQRLQLQCETRDEGIGRASADLEAAERELARLLAPLGISGDPSEAIAERLAAVDAVEAMRGGGPRQARLDIPSIILLLSGVAAVVAGLALAEWAYVLVGAAFAAAGVVFLLRSGHGAPTLPANDERDYLRLLGLEGSVSTLELSRSRRALEAARAAEAGVAGARRALEAARRESELGCDALETRRELWSAWLRERGLDASLTPAAAASVLAVAREARNHGALLQEARTAHAHALEQLGTFGVHFTEVAGAFLGLAGPVAAGDVTAEANRLRDLLVTARDASARRENIGREIAALESRITDVNERMDRARQELLAVYARFDLADGGSYEDLRALGMTAESAAAEASEACDELAHTVHQLEGRLAAGARDSRTGELHVEESALAERLAETVDRYLVLATAARLLGDAQARYQRERQPEVVRRAGEIFTTMTEGRYVGLTVPLADGGIEVFDERSGVRGADMLSRGTAEQLYLAIRLGLISQLGEVGQGLPVIMDDVLVNFDPVRRRGAAAAIVAAAADRQVIFFTCHPETAGLFAEVTDDLARIELPRVCI